MARARLPWTLGELASACQATLLGPEDLTISGVGTLEGAGSGDITFLTNPLYRALLEHTAASAVILGLENRDVTTMPRLVCAQPYVCYARVAQCLFPSLRPAPGVHPSACIDPTAEVDATATIGPLVVIGARAQIAAEVVIEAGTVLGAGVRIGAGSWLYPRVTVYAECAVGSRCILHSGVVLGADGFGMARAQDSWIKIPQVGRVLLGDEVEIGANTTIDRGAIEDTVVEDGVKLDNLIQIGHNCHIGAHTVIAGCTGISGSTRIGRNCRIGGGVGLVGHVEICDGVTISGFSLITKSITEPGVYSSSIPGQPHRQWMQTLAHLRALPKWTAKIQSLEQSLQQLHKE